MPCAGDRATQWANSRRDCAGLLLRGGYASGGGSPSVDSSLGRSSALSVEGLDVFCTALFSACRARPVAIDVTAVHSIPGGCLRPDVTNQCQFSLHRSYGPIDLFCNLLIRETFQLENGDPLQLGISKLFKPSAKFLFGFQGELG